LIGFVTLVDDQETSGNNWNISHRTITGRRVGYATYHATYRSVRRFIPEDKLKQKICNTLLSAENRSTQAQKRRLSLNTSTHLVPNNAYQIFV